MCVTVCVCLCGRMCVTVCTFVWAYVCDCVCVCVDVCVCMRVVSMHQVCIHKLCEQTTMNGLPYCKKIWPNKNFTIFLFK